MIGDELKGRRMEANVFNQVANNVTNKISTYILVQLFIDMIVLILAFL